MTTRLFTRLGPEAQPGDVVMIEGWHYRVETAHRAEDGRDSKCVVVALVADEIRLLVEAEMLVEVERLVEQVATVHERHACPKCHAPKGSRCYRIGVRHTPGCPAPTLKHPHRERVRLEVPDR